MHIYVLLLIVLLTLLKYRYQNFEIVFDLLIIVLEMIGEGMLKITLNVGKLGSDMAVFQ